MPKRLRHHIAGCLWLAVGLVGVATAQSENLSSGTQLSSSVQPLPTTASHMDHTFWDKENVFLFTGVGLFRALDYTSTKNMLARGREEILIPDDVVNSPAGFPALEAAAVATSVGLSYVMHRTGHHKLERWVSIVHIGVTGFGAVRNYALDSKH
jgi:hypothetical protein